MRLPHMAIFLVNLFVLFSHSFVFSNIINENPPPTTTTACRSQPLPTVPCKPVTVPSPPRRRRLSASSPNLSSPLPRHPLFLSFHRLLLPTTFRRHLPPWPPQSINKPLWCLEFLVIHLVLVLEKVLYVQGFVVRLLLLLLGS